MPRKAGSRSLEHWYDEHPCEDRFRYDPHGPYICHTLKDGCYRAVNKGVCPRGIKAPPLQETLPIKATEHTVTFLRDIPAGTYRLVKGG